MTETELCPKLLIELNNSPLNALTDDMLPSPCQSSRLARKISPEVDRAPIDILPTEFRIQRIKLMESLEKPQDFGRESLGVLLESIKMPTQDLGKEFNTILSTDFGDQSVGILPEDFGSESFKIMSTDVERESLGILRVDFGKESLGILPQDWARESLGTLPVDFGKESLGTSLIDFGKESLGILPIEFGRESLGILQQDFVNDLQNENLFIRDSSSFKSILYKPACEKESQNCDIYLLDTSQVNQANTNFADKKNRKPEINISKIGCSLEESYSNPLDMGFVNANSQNSPDLSFNSCSLNGPSQIYCLPRSDSLKSSDYSIYSYMNNAVLINTTKYEYMQRRVQSMSSPVGGNLEVQPQHIFWGTSKSFHGKLNSKEKDNLLDSVFVDGNCTTNKIPDVSVFDESLDDNTNILDSTPQPAWPDELDDSSEKEVPIVPTEAVFKKINKIFPADQDNTNIRLKAEKKTKPKGAKEMLENLSAMWNSNHLSDSQKLEGQNLITSLAELLSNKCNIDNLSDANLNTEDSGHSSICEQPLSSKNENHQCYEILDLRKNSVDILKKPDTCDKPLDLSLKAKSFRSQSVSTQGCSSRLSDNKKLHSSLNSLANHQTSIGNNCSVKNNEKSTRFVQPKLPAKMRSKTTISTKKGPLKAVIPITEMKCKSTLAVGCTPTKIDQRLSKRTSTPIREVKLKPMAASTPIPESLNEPREIKTPDTRNKRSLQGCSTAGVATNSPGKVLNEKTFNEVSTRKSLSGMSVPKNNGNNTFASKLSMIELKRRNSVHETKTNNISKIKRSNSIGKVTGLMTSLSKVRENLKCSPYFNNEKKNMLDNGNIKSMSLLPKMKILGKENILK